LIILLVAVVLILLAAVSGLVVWAASGLGWVLIHWLRLQFTPFEATLLSLIALIAMAWSAWRLLVNLDEDEDEEPEQAQHVSSIPKWRQPIRRASDGMPIVNPDDRCPCGSGRKYKNCHGKK
jgi:cytochrome b subunit of formate dehydrogenase